MITALGLIRNYGGKGLGKYPLNFTLSRFKALRAKKVELAVDLSNIPAVKTYREAVFPNS